MGYEIIKAIIILITGLALSFVSFYIYAEKAKTIISSSLKKELAFAPLYVSSIILLTLTYFIIPTDNDFIHTFSPLELFVPLILTGICYAVSLFPQTAKFLDVAIILSASIASIFLPTDFLMFNGYLPLWADRLAIIMLWSIFSCFYYVLNGIDGILPIFNSSYFAMLILLSVFDAAPLLYGMIGLSLFTVNTGFMVVNWFPAKISLSNNSCKIFGFMIGSIIVFCSTENLAPCFAVILTIFVLELLQSLIKKFSLRERYADLETNTICYQAHIKGLTPEQVCFSISKIEIIFIIMGCFQAYLPNAYSLPIVSIILAAWFLERLKNWNEPKQNLKEINQEFMDDLRQNINEIKNKINRE